MNSKDKDGNIRQCQGCGSIWHSIRDFDQLEKASLVNSVLELPTLSNHESLSKNQILDTIQDFPDDVWFSISVQLAAEEISSSDVAESAYNLLAMLSDQHEILKNRHMDQPALSTATIKSEFVTKSTDMSSMNLSSIKRFMNERVKDLIHSGSTNFEGVMIDICVAKSPSGINAFIRYCAHTAIDPTITKIQQAFRGVGNSTVKSLEKAVICIPLGEFLKIEFSVEFVENDVFTIFGIVHHRRLKCSSNEVDNTFYTSSFENSLGLCERFHSIIKRVYDKLKKGDPSQDKHTKLSLTVYAVNNTVGPDGLTTTTLIYGSVPQLPLTDTDTLPPTEKSRVEAMRTARKEMETITAQNRIK